ncbi:MAG: VanZ family protein [Oscillospiraceae bacterium]|jgi:VanZ family protein
MRGRSASKRRFLAGAFWALSFAWFVFCVFLSSQNGKETGSLSRGIAQAVIRFLGLSQSFLHPLNSYLRTGAHVAVFFVLTLLSGCASGASFPGRRSAPLWPFFPCVLFAVFDEVRKAGIPGRHCSFAEAGLNALGCVLGCTAAYLMFRRYNRRVSDRAHRNQ